MSHNESSSKSLWSITPNRCNSRPHPVCFVVIWVDVFSSHLPRFASCFFFFYLLPHSSSARRGTRLHYLLGNHLSPLITKHHRESFDITRRLQQEKEIHPLLPFVSPASAIPLYPSISTRSFFSSSSRK